MTIAAFNGNARLVKLLLANGADATRIDRTGKGPIVYAAGKGFTSIVRALLDAGVSAEQRYQHDLTALMWAAGHSNDVPEAEGLETVKLLIERGAPLDAVDNRGRTALMTAAERGHPLIARFLMEQGADPALADSDGKTAADLAADAETRALFKL